MITFRVSPFFTRFQINTRDRVYSMMMPTKWISFLMEIGVLGNMLYIMLVSIVTIQDNRIDTLRPVKGVLANSMKMRGNAGATIAQGIRVLDSRSAGSSMCF